MSPAVVPLKVEIIDPGLSETILDINIPTIKFCTTPEILQNPIVKVSRGRIYKTEIHAEIVQKMSRADIYKPGFYAEILHNSKETRVFPYKIHS